MVWELSADELKWIIWGCGLTVCLWVSHFTQQPRCQTPGNVFLFGYHTSIIDSRVKNLTFCKNCIPYLKYFVWLFAIIYVLQALKPRWNITCNQLKYIIISIYWVFSVQLHFTMHISSCTYACDPNSVVGLVRKVGR